MISSSLISLSSSDWYIMIFPTIIKSDIDLFIKMVVVGAQVSSNPEFNTILASFFNFIFYTGETIGLAIAGAIGNNILADFPYLIGCGHKETHITQPISLKFQLAYYTALRGILYFLIGTTD